MSDSKRDFDSAAKSWDDNDRRVKMVRDIAGAIKNNFVFNEKMDILDFGCGTGLLSLQFQPLVRRVTGADSSQGMLDILASKIENLGLNNVRIIYLENGNINSLHGEYDLVMSSMTLHHIKNIPETLAKLNGLIKPGGHICIADLDSDNGLFHSDNTGVFHNGFNRDEMKVELERAGFTGVNALTAAEVVKAGPDGKDEKFTIFLVYGEKQKVR